MLNTTFLKLKIHYIQIHNHPVFSFFFFLEEKFNVWNVNYYETFLKFNARREFFYSSLTGDRFPIIRNAVSVESNRNAILFEDPPETLSAAKNS